MSVVWEAMSTGRNVLKRLHTSRRFPLHLSLPVCSESIRIRQYSLSRPSPSWWNPFGGGGSSNRDSGAQLGSTRTVAAEDAENPRRVQERKDTILALLALEFRRLSLESPNQSREKVVDMAFDSLEQMNLDSKSILQLRHELQSALEQQVVSLFQALGRVDQQGLPFDLDEPDNEGNAILDQVLQKELDMTIEALGNPNPKAAPKGASPNTFLQIKHGALLTLLKFRTKTEPVDTDSSLATSQEKEASEETEETTKNEELKAQPSWVGADDFGYHISIDEYRNQQIRHYQTINMCRSAKLREEWGYSVVALKSSIAGAGRGVYVDGYAPAGSILAFQPGDVWAKEHLVNLPVETERQLEKNDHYQMSLRPDDYMIDSRKSPYTVLTGNHSNSMALGHIINHPTPSNPPNCRTIMVNFTKGMNLGETLKQYIPNIYARPRSFTILGAMMDREAIEMHGMAVIATRDVCNEELFYDYRLMTSQLPTWYHTVQDNAYDEEKEEEVEE